MAELVRQFNSSAMNIINLCVRNILQNETSSEVLEAGFNRLTALQRNVRRMATAHVELEALSDIIMQMLHDIEDQKRDSDQLICFQRPHVQQTGGRPLFIVSREQLLYYAEMGFTTKEMAHLLHVSQSVVKRRLRSHGIKLRTRYSVISDVDLDIQVRALTENNSSLGQRIVQGMLAATGTIVQRERVADSLIRVDEASVAMRCVVCTRWGFVIHGGIDGFSRLVTFLSLATNNKAETMTEAFVSGVTEFGCPSRVRSDHGLENVGVGAFMIAYRGPRRGSYITGRSVHNQRIERLWRDLFQSCTSVFHRLFYHMEDTRLLDISNDIHLWSLQYVFRPRIYRAIQQFKDAWNNHRLRTEEGRSPRQIYIRGILEQAGQGNRGVDDLFFEPEPEPLPEAQEDYGVDIEAPIPEDRLPSSAISNVPCPLTDEAYRQLCEEVDPLSMAGLGVPLYVRVLEFCSEHAQ